MGKMNERIEEIGRFFYVEINPIVEKLFKELRENHIDVTLEKTELREETIFMYNKIYKEYEQALICVKNKAHLKFGDENYVDLIFAIIIQEIVKKKQEL